MMSVQLLDGTWKLSRTGQGGERDIVGDARVPGAIHYDLVRHGLLSNPFAGSQAALDAGWVARSEWEFSLSFDNELDEKSERAVLEFDGIDTFADVWLNGSLVGQTSNALRPYRFPLESGALRATGNSLSVIIHGHQSGIPEERMAEARERMGHTSDIEGLLGKSLIRRYQRNFASNSSLLNIGTAVLGLGIIGPVRLLGLASAEVRGAFVETTALSASEASLRVEVLVEAEDYRDLTVVVELRDAEGALVTSEETIVDGPRRDVFLTVTSPQSWWPRGYGEPYLYTAVTIVRRRGIELDRRERRVGIRTVELITAREDQRPVFQFRVNGVPVYVRGTNYIPVDYLGVHPNSEQLERVFTLLEIGNNNLVRMWGGGATESDAFYDECDARGIMLWQDFYLHSNMYPDYDAAWVDEFREEVRLLALFAREHASLVILCGGNEQREGWEEWQWKDLVDEFWGERLVTDVVPDVLSAIPTGVPYIDNSPHGGRWSQSPVKGEGHIWGNHFNSLKDPLFVTETCWGQESYSRPDTLREVMDLDVDDFCGGGWPRRWTALTGLPVLTRFPYTNYHNTGGLREYLSGLEAEQGWADYFSMGNFRLRSPSCRGMVYWSFNKGGPLFQFGSVDYALRPLMSFYVLGRLYADVVVGAYRDNDDVRVVASNARAATVRATLEVVHLDGAGERLGVWTSRVEIATGAPQRLIDLDRLYQRVADRSTESVYVRLTLEDGTTSDDHLLFAPVSEFLPHEPRLNGRLERASESEWLLHLASSGVSKAVEIHHGDDVVPSDNHFPLISGLDRTVRLHTFGGAKLGSVRVSSLDHAHSLEVMP